MSQSRWALYKKPMNKAIIYRKSILTASRRSIEIKFIQSDAGFSSCDVFFFCFDTGRCHKHDKDRLLHAAGHRRRYRIE
jgi:hypothetical protein